MQVTIKSYLFSILSLMGVASISNPISPIQAFQLPARPIQVQPHDNSSVTLSNPHVTCFNRHPGSEHLPVNLRACEPALDQLWRKPDGSVRQHFGGYRGIIRETVLFSLSPCTIGLASKHEGDVIYASIRDVLAAAQRILQRCSDVRNGGVEYLKEQEDQWVVFVIQNTGAPAWLAQSMI